MAKEFKEFDKKFAHLKRTDADESLEDQQTALTIDRWDRKVDSWIQADVQLAVYQVADHERWQQFRVSLKGQSTRMKLLRLKRYYDEQYSKAQGIQQRIEKIRIDNYIGSLRRGGLLDSNYKVIK